MTLFESDLIWSNQMIPRKRATRTADNINEIVKENLMKRLFSKTPAKKSSSSIKCSISKKL
jgi:hypothetical protein